MSRSHRQAQNKTEGQRPGRPIPAFAPSGTGDDVVAARAFIDATVGGMRGLRSDDDAAVLDWLDVVEGGARPLNARAIARAAVETRKLVGTKACGAAIHTLGTLVAQYEQGLVDVEVQMETSQRSRPYLGPAVPEVIEKASVPSIASRDKWEEARDLLMGLMPQAESTGHQDALQKLASFDAESVGTDTEVAPIEPEAEAPALDMSAPDVPAPVVHDKPGLRRAAFDVEPLLPSLVDHAHRAAARAGKKLTASYAARDAYLPPELATEWQEAVETAIAALVAATLEAPDVRQARGETAAAHMAMTVEGREDGVSLLIRCPGRMLPRMVVEAPHELTLSQEEGTVVLHLVARADGDSADSSAA